MTIALGERLGSAGFSLTICVETQPIEHDLWRLYRLLLGWSLRAVPVPLHNDAGGRHLDQACGAAMLTSQPMPNRSVHMPKTSPHICFSSGIDTVPPSISPVQ